MPLSMQSKGEAERLPKDPKLLQSRIKELAKAKKRLKVKLNNTEFELATESAEQQKILRVRLNALTIWRN